ncbi:small acid-soluble spore protein P [Halalkalibacter sp. AB-rgal2]
MTEHNTYSEQRRNAQKNHQSNSQPGPLSGSKKVKKHNHTHQAHAGRN